MAQKPVEKSEVKEMKKVLFLFLITLQFISCDMFYFSASKADLAKVKSKTTYQSFEHLNEPIVIAMKVYDQKNLFGKEDWGNYVESHGNIFVILDWETDTVYDWVYTGEGPTFTNWRGMQVGENPKRYYISTWYSGAMCYISENETKPTTLYHKYPTFMRAYNIKTDYSILDGYRYNHEIENEELTYQIFNAKTNEVSSKIHAIETDSIGYISNIGIDPEGNFWVATMNHESSKEYVASLWQIKSQTDELIGPIKQYQCQNAEASDDPNERILDYYAVDCVNDKYVFLKRGALGMYTHDTKIVLIDYKTEGYPEKLITIPFDENVYLEKIIAVNNKIYLIFPGTSGSEYVEIRSLDLNSLEVYKESSFNFDYTENVWVRGSRIYFMSSRNPNNCYYTWYDTETKQQGEVFNLNFEDIIYGK